MGLPSLVQRKRGEEDNEPKGGKLAARQAPAFGVQASQGAPVALTDGVTVLLTYLRISSGDWQLTKEALCARTLGGEP